MMILGKVQAYCHCHHVLDVFRQVVEYDELRHKICHRWSLFFLHIVTHDIEKSSYNVDLSEWKLYFPTAARWCTFRAPFSSA